MIELDWETDRTEGVTLISAIVTNALTTPQIVRIENRVDGPLWTPNGDRRSAPEWSDGCWEGLVEPNRRRGLGFASLKDPAAIADPPLAVTDTHRASDRVSEPTDVLASMADWRPPLDSLDRVR
ncbi:DUF7857 domain-containing protein [Natrinema versiforme]|uniref:Uncharacterized protein n=1 Tax=Natrinema versiforme JCM 10478 TaxID=1227496 RepID=L9Y112_9EURY|nr:hypothetical protein [Natrinema versiforme]ELY67730.1 hypothetical protein C489_09226 [Natrinema versiforme JCM 10478]